MAASAAAPRLGVLADTAGTASPLRGAPVEVEHGC